MPEGTYSEVHEMDQLLARLMGAIDDLPASVRNVASKEIMELVRIFHDRRHPRIMLLGRRGAGKSSLINAICSARVRGVGAVRAQTGAPQWEVFQFGGRTVEILDTRGVQEGSVPSEGDSHSSAMESLRAAVRARCPDVILFLVKAKEVDSAIHADLDALEKIHRAVVAEQPMRSAQAVVKIIPVLTQCDELDPRDLELSSGDPEKLANIDTAVQLLSEHLQGRSYLVTHLGSEVVPTSAVLFFQADGSPNPRRDYRWNIDQLALEIQAVLPDAATLEFIRLAQFRKVQVKFARRIVAVFSTLCGAVGATPIPIADLPFITALQIQMIIIIGFISGRKMSRDVAREFLVSMGLNFGVAVGFRELARGLVKFIPMAGDLISGAVAANATIAVGNAAIMYFIDRQPADVVRKKFTGRAENG